MFVGTLGVLARCLPTTHLWAAHATVALDVLNFANQLLDKLNIDGVWSLRSLRGQRKPGKCEPSSMHRLAQDHCLKPKELLQRVVFGT
jgi:hypothetical protein